MKGASIRTCLEAFDFPDFCVAILTGRDDSFVIQPHDTSDLRLRMCVWNEKFLNKIDPIRGPRILTFNDGVFSWTGE